MKIRGKIVICFILAMAMMLTGCSGKKAKDKEEQTEASSQSEESKEAETEEEETEEVDPDEDDGLVKAVAEDSCFSVKYGEGCEHEWQEEEGYWGGIYIYPNSTDSFPSVEVRRFDDIDASAEDFLDIEYTDFRVRRSAGSGPVKLNNIGKLKEYDLGGEKVPGIVYTLGSENEDVMDLLSVAKKEGDSILFFQATYYLDDDEKKEWAMDVLDTAVATARLEKDASSDDSIEKSPDDQDIKKAKGSDLETITAGNGLYRTEYDKSCSAEWIDEEGYWGGVGVYPDANTSYPYAQMRLYENISISPAEFLRAEYSGYLQRLDDNGDSIKISKTEGPYEYNIGGRKLPGILYTIDHDDGSVYKQFALADKETDDKNGKEYLVQFVAGYYTEDISDSEWAMTGLDTLIRGFELTGSAGQLDPDALEKELAGASSDQEIKAKDGTFTVTCSDGYRTKWAENGLQIFPDEELDSPYIFVYAKEDADIDAGQWVEEVDWTNILKKMEPDNAEYTPVEEYEFGGKKFQGIEFKYVQNVASTYPGPEYCLCLAAKEGDTIIDYNVYYYPGEKDDVLEVLDEIVGGTELTK